MESPPDTAAAGAGGMGGDQMQGGTSGSGGAGGSAQAGGGVSGSGGMMTMAMPDAAAEASSLPPNDGGGLDTGAIALPKRVLLYHFSTLVINSVPAQLTFLKSKLMEWGFDNDDSVDPATFTDDNLAKYAAVAMINTCFEPFGAGKPDVPQSQALQRFLQRGGGLFGTHCAAVTFQSAKPPVLYNNLIGGRDGGNNFMGASTCTKVADHPSTTMMPASIPYNGNLDQEDFLATDTTVLVKCKWSGNGNKEVSTSWFRMEGSGRVFFTNFAKEDTDLKDTTLGADHILPGLSWVLRR
jgi:type 1 glutamine amidotransferase